MTSENLRWRVDKIFNLIYSTLCNEKLYTEFKSMSKNSLTKIDVVLKNKLRENNPCQQVCAQLRGRDRS